MDKATRANIGRKAETVGFINSEKFDYKVTYSGEFYRKFYRVHPPVSSRVMNRMILSTSMRASWIRKKKLQRKRKFGTINIMNCVHAHRSCPDHVGI